MRRHHAQAQAAATAATAAARHQTLVVTEYAPGDVEGVLEPAYGQPALTFATVEEAADWAHSTGRTVTYVLEN